jgi:hypothetical protein
MDDDDLLSESEFIVFQFLTRICQEHHIFPDASQLDALVASLPSSASISRAPTHETTTTTSFTNDLLADSLGRLRLSKEGALKELQEDEEDQEPQPVQGKAFSSLLFI